MIHSYETDQVAVDVDRALAPALGRLSRGTASTAARVLSERRRLAGELPTIAGPGLKNPMWIYVDTKFGVQQTTSRVLVQIDPAAVDGTRLIQATHPVRVAFNNPLSQ